MDSWVYLFSKFTPEALLIEGFFLSSLVAVYAAYWILKKRKIGAAGNVIPAGLMKGYLNELIGEAEGLRSQLFGLLRTAGEQPSSDFLAKLQMGAHGSAHAGAGNNLPTVNADPALQQKILLLETQMVEQAKAMQDLETEKQKLSEELVISQTTKVDGGGGDGAGNADLQAKIDALEARLAEYSIIEDDLANLKRLQQENAKLKAQLEGMSSAQPTAAPVAAAAPAAVAAPNPVADPVADLIAELSPETPAAAATPEPAAPSTQDAAAEQAFLEQLMAEASGATATPPAAAAAAAEALPAAPPPATSDADQDLLAEFEKMLNS